MLYLSNLTGPKDHPLLQNIYRLHQVIEAGFDGLTKAEKGRTLFRIEPPHGELISVLVQSSGAPLWGGKCVGNRLRDFETRVKRWQPKFTVDLNLGFRLRGCFRKTFYGRECYRTQRDDIFDRFARKIETSANLLDIGLKERRDVEIIKRDYQIKFPTFTLEGRLSVLDPENLVQTVTRGLGDEKAFGCGLLSLRF